MKALFLDADGTLWYVGDEEGDGYQRPFQDLKVDPQLPVLFSEMQRRSIPIWIVSYNEPGRVETLVEHLDLSRWISREKISCNWRDKSERIVEIMQRNGICKALFIGDRGSDYRASLAAGIDGRIVKRRFNKAQWTQGPMVPSLIEPIQLLEAI